MVERARRATATPRAVIATVDRDRAEALKRQEEREKFIAEQRKSFAEAAKPGLDGLLAPWLTILGLIGGIITIASAVARLARG